MFLDHFRRKHRDPKRWNVACDYRINLYLKDSGLELDDTFLLDERFRGMDAEKIYDFLMYDPEDPANQLAEDNGGCGCGGLKDHPSRGKSPGDKGDDEDQSDQGSNGDLTNVSFGESEALMALAQAHAFAKAQGKLPGSIDELVGEILNPKVRWEQVLQRFMENCSQDDFSWQAPDRRFLYLDVYLPSIESEGVDTFVVCADVSGSTLPYIQQFLGEISQIAKVLKFRTLYVMYCDAAVQHVDEYGREDLPIKPPRTYGGGGTDFRPVFNWLDERIITPKGMIYLTDTYGAFPKVPPPYPVLWTVPKDAQRASVPFGEIVTIN
jgi:predicted metal-dependent peptidase